MDGITAALQDRLRMHHEVSSPYKMMFAVNLFSALYLCLCEYITSLSNRSPYRIQCVIVALTGLPIGYSVIVALTDLPPFLPDLLVTGEGWAGTQFVHRHPSMIIHLLAFSVASALGQV